jgi:plasmid stabilization system protein ParE
VRVRLTLTAAAELRGIARKVKADNGTVAAARISGKITATLHHLRHFPELGQPGREPGTRELGVAGLPWLVVYEIGPDGIDVARIVHGAMLWPPAED